MRKPTSYAAKKAKNMMDESISDLDGIDEFCIKAIHFFLDQIVGLYKYKLNILYKNDPKQIIIHVFDTENKERFFKLKDKNALKILAAKIGIPNYTIRFAESGDIIEH